MLRAKPNGWQGFSGDLSQGMSKERDNSFSRQRARMVEGQLRHRGIRDERVLTVMSELPR